MENIIKDGEIICDGDFVQDFSWVINTESTRIPVPLHGAQVGVTTWSSPESPEMNSIDYSTITNPDMGEFTLSIPQSKLFQSSDKVSLLVWALIPDSGYNPITKKVVRRE
jgi:hypothetical protein